MDRHLMAPLEGALTIRIAVGRLSPTSQPRNRGQRAEILMPTMAGTTILVFPRLNMLVRTLDSDLAGHGDYGFANDCHHNTSERLFAWHVRQCNAHQANGCLKISISLAVSNAAPHSKDQVSRDVLIWCSSQLSNRCKVRSNGLIGQSLLSGRASFDRRVMMVPFDLALWVPR